MGYRIHYAVRDGMLQAAVSGNTLGRSSLSLKFEFHGGDKSRLELRLKARQVLVCTSLLTHKPQALPDDVRAALLPYLGMEPGI